MKMKFLPGRDLPLIFIARYKRMHSALRVLGLGHRYSLEKSGSFSPNWCNANLCGRRHFIVVACGLPRDYSSRNSLRSHLDKSELARSLCVTITICLPLNGCKHEQSRYSTYIRSTITFIYRIYDPNVRLYAFPEKIQNVGISIPIDVIDMNLLRCSTDVNCA